MKKANGKITWSQIAPPPLVGFIPPGTYQAPQNYPNATPNHVPTVLSAGPNAKWDADLFGSGTDNLLGFRLRREGTQGN